MLLVILVFKNFGFDYCILIVKLLLYRYCLFIQLYRVLLMRNVIFYFLGLSIVGGREIFLGQYGVYIIKVKKGSIVDMVGYLRLGM